MSRHCNPFIDQWIEAKFTYSGLLFLWPGIFNNSRLAGGVVVPNSSTIGHVAIISDDPRF
jgi:hypothetical protein